MRTPTMAFAILAIGACANLAPATTPYDEVAQTLGAQLATPGGGGELTALTDATMIARGAPESRFTHDGLVYRYQVYCFDTLRRPLAACGEATVSAKVIAMWSGMLHMPRFEATIVHEAIWNLRGLDTAASWVTGTSSSTYRSTFGPATRHAVYFDVTTAKEITLIWNPSAMEVRGGSQTAAITSVQEELSFEDRTTELTGTITFDRADRATLMLDERSYWIDRTTGETTVVTEPY